jgi:hypothetical protein
MMWTEEKLAKLNAEQRHQLWLNASSTDTDVGQAAVAAIENSGLSFMSPKGLQLDSQTGRALYRIIFSQAAKDAGAAATDEGRPALADIEPLIVSELGEAYSEQYEVTVQAGHLVSRMMNVNGFNKTNKRRPMPAGSISKSAELYKRKS